MENERVRSNSHAEAQAKRSGGSIGRAAVSPKRQDLQVRCPPCSVPPSSRCTTSGRLLNTEKGQKKYIVCYCHSRLLSLAHLRNDEARFLRRIFAFLREVIARVEEGYRTGRRRWITSSRISAVRRGDAPADFRPGLSVRPGSILDLW